MRDRAKAGSKYHLVVDRHGIPLATALSAANTHDSLLFERVTDAISPIVGPRGRPGRPRLDGGAEPGVGLLGFCCLGVRHERRADLVEGLLSSPAR